MLANVEFIHLPFPKATAHVTAHLGGGWYMDVQAGCCIYVVFINKTHLVYTKCIYGFMEAVTASAFLLHVTGFDKCSFVARTV